jgi:two-component system chemotaxis response regulator CheB
VLRHLRKHSVGPRALGVSADADAAVAKHASEQQLCISFSPPRGRMVRQHWSSMDLPYAIVIGASSGGVSALLEVVAGLPADLPAVVGVVLHVGSQQSILPELLSARGALPAGHARDDEPLRPGRIYVAPPDRHMLFTPKAVQLNRGPRENHARPAIDPLFRSVAVNWRNRAVGVILTGYLDDGTAGLAAIKDCGGTAIVQDPATALEPSMPASAMANVAVDLCLPLHGIAAALRERVTEKPVGDPPVPEGLLHEQAVFEGAHMLENLKAVAAPSTFTCPDCGGALWEVKDTRPLRYRCHTGHAFTARSLENLQAEVAEHAMWSSVRSLQEREMLLRRLAAVSRATGDAHQADVGVREAERLHEQIKMLIGLIEGETSSA